MGVLELFGGQVVEATVQAPVVVRVDPACGDPLDVRDVAVRPGVEHGGADALGLEQAELLTRGAPALTGVDVRLQIQRRTVSALTLLRLATTSAAAVGLGYSRT